MDKIENIHFIGIGGIGVSALARMMLKKGKKVSGSDCSFSSIIKDLRVLGAKISLSHKPSNVSKKIDLVVYTVAVDGSNPEIKKAKQLNIPLISYPQMLGLISKDYYTIAISGTHGKSTVTAMLTKVFCDNGLDPTVIVGALLNKTNFIQGKGKYFIVEACEHKESFLNLEPRILAITNIDNDHLDYYKSFKNIKKAFSKLISKTRDYLVCDAERIKPNTACNVIDYTKEQDIKLGIPGKHNIQNAKVVMAIAKIAGIPRNKAVKSLRRFSGIPRRFEFKGKTKNNVLVYDDYAHHPTEIKATLKTAREFFKNKNITVVFQPHLYSRTKLLLKEFAKSFKYADQVIIAPIYAAREKKDKTISSKILAKEISNAICIKSFKQIQEFLKKNTNKHDVIITMGAGDIFKVGEDLL